MKLLIVAASLIVSSAAMATPAIGDTANYNATVTTGSGQVVTGTITDALTEFNAQTSQYKQTETTVSNGQTQSSEKWVDAKDFMSDAQIVQVLNVCASAGAKFEAVAVGTTSINACAFPVNNESKGTIWIGQVPFGIVKLDLTDSTGKHTEASLTSYQVGH